MDATKNIAIIPARGGSQRIPRKNLMEFNGKPMISRAIETCIETMLFEEIVVSTDDIEVADIARRAGANVPFIRPGNLADSHMPTAPVISHALKELAAQNKIYTHCCCVYPCTPLLTPRDIHDVLESLQSSAKSFAYPVVKYSHPIQRAMRMSGDGTRVFREPEAELKRTQEFETYYHDAGQFYWGRVDAWISGGQMHSDGIGVELPNSILIDIDNYNDVRLAKLIEKSLSDQKSAQGASV